MSAMNDNAKITVTEAVIDPRWRVLTIELGKHIVLRFTHPRHGDIDFILPDKEATGIADALQKAVADKCHAS
jgi:hypothetical protein